MKDVKVEELLRVLEEHKILFKMLGYELDVEENTIPVHLSINILKNNKIVGTITHKDKNMYWLKEKNEILVNENINNMRFNQVPKYNKKPVFHIIINDGKFRCNCYNIFNKNYIGIANNKIKIKKFKDFIKIEVVNDNLNTKFCVIYPDRLDNEEKYTNKINNLIGFDVISNIESYYNNDKIKIKKRR